MGLIGSILAERYEIRALLGEGAMASVYDAFDVREDRAVAIKIPHSQVLASTELSARFEREAYAAITVDHPGVVRAFELGRTPDGIPYLVFERAPGDALDQVLSFPVRWPRVVLVGYQIAQAVESLHERGIIHRDLKPENILVARGDKDEDLVKVLDFGVAKLSGLETGPDDGMTRLGYVYGTPEYMAPEQALGQEVDDRADVYSVGVILYELVTGRRPYSGKAKQLLGQQLTKPIPSLRQLAGSEVPQGLEDLVTSMLAVTCAARPKMSEVREKLGELKEKGGREPAPSKTRTGSAPSRPGKPSTIRVPHMVFVGVLSAVLGAIGALSWHRDAPPEGAVPPLSPASADPPPTPTSSPTSSPTSEVRNAEEILGALSSPSLDDLIALSREHSSEPLIQLELARAYLEAKEYSSAVETATTALGLDPSLNRNPKLGVLLTKTAQMQSASDATFRLLRGPMGQEGADILYELSQSQNVKPLIRTQATAALDSARVRENLSLPLALALELGAARSCKELKPLIERALLLGDSRALSRLESLNSNLACKKPGLPCYPCLREKSGLAEAITAIRERSGEAETSAMSTGH